MGVTCQIFIHKPPDEVFRPGSHVIGTVQYSVNKDTVFHSITASLRGYGFCEWDNSETVHPSTFEGNDVYVNTKMNLLQNNTGIAVTGTYNAPFHFILPHNIPSNFVYESWWRNAEIDYYIRLKFVESGVFHKTRRFLHNIKVLSPLTPITEGPLVSVVHKNVTNMFATDNREISVKTTVDQPNFPPGGRIDFRIDVENSNKIDHPTVKVMLVRRIILRADCGRISIFDKVLDECKIKAELLGRDTVISVTRSLHLPDNALTIQYSRAITRDYVLKVMLKVGGLHSDIGSEMIILVGETLTRNAIENPTRVPLPLREPQPPPYWELMVEKTDKRKKTKKAEDMNN